MCSVCSGTTRVPFWIYFTYWFIQGIHVIRSFIFSLWFVWLGLLLITILLGVKVALWCLIVLGSFVLVSYVWCTGRDLIIAARVRRRHE